MIRRYNYGARDKIKTLKKGDYITVLVDDPKGLFAPEISGIFEIVHKNTLLEIRVEDEFHRRVYSSGINLNWIVDVIEQKS
jgi:hypothetical protein